MPLSWAGSRWGMGDVDGTTRDLGWQQLVGRTILHPLNFLEAEKLPLSLRKPGGKQIQK